MWVWHIWLIKIISEYKCHSYIKVVIADTQKKARCNSSEKVPGHNFLLMNHAPWYNDGQVHLYNFSSEPFLFLAFISFRREWCCKTGTLLYAWSVLTFYITPRGSADPFTWLFVCCLKNWLTYSSPPIFGWAFRLVRFNGNSSHDDSPLPDSPFPITRSITYEYENVQYCKYIQWWRK